MATVPVTQQDLIEKNREALELAEKFKVLPLDAQVADISFKVDKLAKQLNNIFWVGVVLIAISIAILIIVTKTYSII